MTKDVEFGIKEQLITKEEIQKRLKELGHSVIYGIEDFLKSNKYEFDYIITNPPFLSRTP